MKINELNIQLKDLQLQFDRSKLLNTVELMKYVGRSDEYLDFAVKKCNIQINNVDYLQSKTEKITKANNLFNKQSAMKANEISPGLIPSLVQSIDNGANIIPLVNRTTNSIENSTDIIPSLDIQSIMNSTINNDFNNVQVNTTDSTESMHSNSQTSASNSRKLSERSSVKKANIKRAKMISDEKTPLANEKIEKRLIADVIQGGGEMSTYLFTNLPEDHRITEYVISNYKDPLILMVLQNLRAIIPNDFEIRQLIDTLVQFIDVIRVIICNEHLDERSQQQYLVEMCLSHIIKWLKLTMDDEPSAFIFEKSITNIPLVAKFGTKTKVTGFGDVAINVCRSNNKSSDLSDIRVDVEVKVNDRLLELSDHHPMNQLGFQQVALIQKNFDNEVEVVFAGVLTDINNCRISFMVKTTDKDNKIHYIQYKTPILTSSYYFVLFILLFITGTTQQFYDFISTVQLETFPYYSKATIDFDEDFDFTIEKYQNKENNSKENNSNGFDGNNGDGENGFGGNSNGSKNGFDGNNNNSSNNLNGNNNSNSFGGNNNNSNNNSNSFGGINHLNFHNIHKIQYLNMSNRNITSHNACNSVNSDDSDDSDESCVSGDSIDSNILSLNTLSNDFDEDDENEEEEKDDETEPITIEDLNSKFYIFQ